MEEEDAPVAWEDLMRGGGMKAALSKPSPLLRMNLRGSVGSRTQHSAACAAVPTFKCYLQIVGMAGQ